MIRNTEGIVLKTAIYGEADLIVTYLSKDFGIVKAFAKSPRKITSRFGSSLEPLTYSKIALLGKENISLPRLTRSDIIKSFNDLRENINCFIELSEIIKMNLSLIHEGSTVKELFDLLYKTLIYLQQGYDRAMYLLFYKIKFLERTGYMPNLDVCGLCGREIKKFSNNSINFHINHGSILCNNCSSFESKAININKSSLVFYSALRNWHIQKLSRLSAHPSVLIELSQTINAHIGFITAKK
ncbi:MAG TPA: DNA repair protein RecO [Nitrospirae bacterium]|nr:DNA repair protein RecO [Nitrospirota bacterium]